MAAHHRSSPAPRGSGQTQVQTPSAPTITSTGPRRQAVLHLRGATRENVEAQGGDVSTANGRRIQWAEDVVDNEGLGRKSSKVCCIYHAPKPIDESSDESSSDSDDSESDSGDDGGARPPRGQAHGDGHNHDHGHDHGGKGKGTGKGKARARSPNAYEKIPKPRSGGGGVVKKG